jgi:hypothetical protein
MDRLHGAGGVKTEVAVPGTADPAGGRRPGDQRVHRIRGLEPDRGAAGAAERLQDLLDGLVGAVGGPDLAPAEPMPEVGGEVRAQRDRVPVGVPVQRASDTRYGVRDGAGQLRRWWVGILVGVEPDRHVQLRCAVGDPAGQIRPERQLGRR